MPKKIILNAEMFTVPLSKLLLSPRNVRKTYTEAEIEDLAASIAAPGRGLIQNLAVSEQVDSEGTPTGMWEVVSGGRRYRALKLLAARKRLAAAVAIPCRRVEDEGAVDASLAENEDRKALHPADAYEAFAELHKKGSGAGVEEIAARFSVSAHIVRQRLRLGSVSPVIMAAYREGGLTLDQVMAFTVTQDRNAQERTFNDLPEYQYHRTPQAIRRVLTSAAIPAHDPRVCLVGIDTYSAAGGQVQRDLFTEDGGGWLTDAALLERLVSERIQAAVAQVQAEGWKWVVADPATARMANHTNRRVWPEAVELPEADQVRQSQLTQRFDEIGAEYTNGIEDAPEEVQAEVQAIDAELDALEQRMHAFRPEDVARGGVTIVLARSGTLMIERGFIQPEDEQPDPALEAAVEESDPAQDEGDDEETGSEDGGDDEGRDEMAQVRHVTTHEATPEEKTLPLSSELLGELTAHRTAALRVEIMRQPDLALRVLAHSLAIIAFYAPHFGTVARLGSMYATSYGTGAVASDSPARQAIKAAEDEQRAKLPGNHGALWDWLQAQDVPTLHGLLAVCVGRMADAGAGDWTDAGQLGAQVGAAAGLDMRQWWTVSQASYLSRVTKAGILAAVEEGAGADAARRIEGMKKEAMAANAETLLTGKGWLPARLRVPALEGAASEAAAAANDAGNVEYSAAAE